MKDFGLDDVHRCTSEVEISQHGRRTKKPCNLNMRCIQATDGTLFYMCDVCDRNPGWKPWGAQ